MATVQLNHTSEMLANVQSIFDVRRKACFALLTVCTPAIVYAKGGEDEDGVVYVIPLIKKMYADGGSEELHPVKTTLATIQHGGFYVHSPVYVGDTGWLFSADGDTEKVKSENSSVLGGDVKPGELDDDEQLIANAGPQEPDLPKVHHSFTHGFFLPDKWGGVPMPDELKDSFVIEQVKPGDKKSNSKGRFVMDPDGTIRIFSTRWYDGKETDVAKRLKSGSVIVDLSWYGKSSPLEKKPSWRLGDFTVDANSLLEGDVRIRPWTDEDGKKHGGNLEVEGEGRFGSYLGVNGDVAADGNLHIGGESDFRKKMEIVEDHKKVVINPKEDLHKTDARFRKVLVVTGLEHDKNSKNKVALHVQEMRVLADWPEDRDPVEFEVGGGGGGSVEVDDKSIDFSTDSELEFLEFQTKDTEDESLAELMTTSSTLALNKACVERAGAENNRSVKYRMPGSFVCGTDSKIEFTSDNQGNVTVNVYYV